MNMSQNHLERISSGIPGLDTILKGGFIKGGVYLLLGPPGTGKTIFANQMCFHHAKKENGSIVYVTLLAESHGRMMENLRPLKYFEDDEIAQKIHYMGGYHVLEKDGLKGFLRLIAGIVKEKNASILMIDGMSTIGELEQSAITFRKFAHELNSYLSSSGCTAFLLSSMEGHLSKPEHTMVDGIISFHYENYESRVRRQIEVRKFRGSGHFYGKHQYKIDNAGITVYPRIECQNQERDVYIPTNQRQCFGIDGLDSMVMGGLRENTFCTFIGSAGTGKTSVALQFLACGAASGEKGLFLGLYERPEELLIKSDNMSLDFTEYVNKKLIEILWQPALESEMDELAYKLLNAVKTHKVKRVVIDGMDGLVTSVSNPDRIRPFMTALMMELKRLGVTTIMIEETSYFGNFVNRQFAEMSALNEAVIYFHHEAVNEEIINAITVLKLRNSSFDKRTKRLEITSEGVEVIDPQAVPRTVVTAAKKTKSTKKAPVKKKTSAKKGKK